MGDHGMSKPTQKRASEKLRLSLERRVQIQTRWELHFWAMGHNLPHLLSAEKVSLMLTSAQFLIAAALGRSLPRRETAGPGAAPPSPGS